MFSQITCQLNISLISLAYTNVFFKLDSWEPWVFGEAYQGFREALIKCGTFLRCPSYFYRISSVIILNYEYVAVFKIKYIRWCILSFG